MSDDHRPQIHELKVWPEFYEALLDGRKTFEIRPDDRGFAVGDYLLLREWSRTDGYSGRAIEKRVTYITRDAPHFGVSRRFCVLAITDSLT